MVSGTVTPNPSKPAAALRTIATGLFIAGVLEGVLRHRLSEFLRLPLGRSEQGEAGLFPLRSDHGL